MATTHRVVFLYGSETGVSEEYCYLVASIAANNGVEVTVLPIDEYPIELWGVAGAGDNTEVPPIVFFVSTAGQGDMPLTMHNTWARLRMSDAPLLSPLCRYAVFGLGDSTYSRYNYAAKMFHNRIQQLGAAPLVHRGLGDERDGKGIWQELGPWLETSLWPALNITIADTSLLIPHNRFTIGAVSASAASDSQAASVGHRGGCWDFAVKTNKRLTAPEHFQHVSFVEFYRDSDVSEGVDASDSEDGAGVPHGRGFYQPGDCLALYPTNSAREVGRVLKLLNITDEAADELVTVTPNSSWGLARQPARFFTDKPISIRELLTRFIDLEGTVSQTFLRMFALCAQATGDVELVERMAELGTPRNCEDYNGFAYREKRTMSEVMEDFPSVSVPLDFFVSSAPLMRPRYYSISSSPTMDKDIIGITVARFDLKTPLGRERQGLCSRLLCSAEGDNTTIEGCFLRRPFAIDERAPLILIGPGTGVAPLRGLIRERWALANTVPHEEAGAAYAQPPEMVLFFGCRNRERDNLHGDEWVQFSPSLHVFTAFSRDAANGQKEYVQHKMIDDSAAATRVFRLLTNTTDECGGGAVVIICGNAKHMPASVQDALARILAAGRGLSKEDALVEVNRMRARGRIIFETWSV